jgi:hypothetical protein
MGRGAAPVFGLRTCREDRRKGWHREPAVRGRDESKLDRKSGGAVRAPGLRRYGLPRRDCHRRRFFQGGLATRALSPTAGTKIRISRGRRVRFVPNDDWSFPPVSAYGAWQRSDCFFQLFQTVLKFHGKSLMVSLALFLTAPPFDALPKRLRSRFGPVFG